jgi:hypothetical protein
MRPLATALITVSLITISSGQTTSTDSGAHIQRPLKLPVLRANERCPVTTGWTWRHPDYIFGGIDWFGEGPVYVTFAWGRGERASFSLAPIPIVGGMRRAKTPWAAEPSYSGPVTIRGRSLDDDGRPLRFSEGMEETPVEQLHIQAPNRAPYPGAYSWWPTSMFIPGSGCYGIQIDTTKATQVVIFEGL